MFARDGYVLDEIDKRMVVHAQEKMVIVVEGPPGSGKSVLAAHLWASLAQSGRVDGNIVFVTTSGCQRKNWENLLATSLFARLRQSHPQSIAMLNTSYRLNEPICDFVAGNFYGGIGNVISSASSRNRRLKLTCNDNSPIDSRILDALGGEAALVWIRSEDNGSQQLNLAEAELVAKLVSQAMKAGMRTDEMAIVTPYRRQAAAIRRLIQYETGSSIDIPIVDTVERVQGLTVELVVISMCTTDPEYASETASFIFSPNRFNVAASRARTKVVIFAAESILEALPTNYDGLVAMKTFQRALNAIDANALSNP